MLVGFENFVVQLCPTIGLSGLDELGNPKTRISGLVITNLELVLKKDTAVRFSVQSDMWFG